LVDDLADETNVDEKKKRKREVQDEVDELQAELRQALREGKEKSDKLQEKTEALSLVQRQKDHFQHELLGEIKVGGNAVIRGLLERELSWMKCNHDRMKNDLTNNLFQTDPSTLVCRQFQTMAHGGVGKNTYLAHWRICPYVLFKIQIFQTPTTPAKLTTNEINTAIDNLYATTSSHIHNVIKGDDIIVPRDIPQTERLAMVNFLTQLGLTYKWQEDIDGLSVSKPIPSSSSSSTST